MSNPVRTTVNTVIFPHDPPQGEYVFANILNEGPNKSYKHKNIWYAIADYSLVIMIILGFLAWLVS